MFGFLRSLPEMRSQRRARRNLQQEPEQQWETGNDRASSTESALCERCSSLDLLEIFHRKIPLEQLQKVIVCELGDSAVLRKSPCRLCQLFGTVAYPFYATPDQGPHKLLILRPEVVFEQENFEKRNAVRDLDDPSARIQSLLPPLVYPWMLNGSVFKTNVLSVENSSERFQKSHLLGLINLKSDHRALGNNFGVRLLELDSFDIPLARHWIEYCHRKHPVNCAAQSHDMKPISVIDCETQKVIKAPQDCKYVALSYLWGAAAATTKGQFSSLQTAPKVILDSMYVTKRMGYKYLWVDRYCINQTDSIGKHEQICQMDIIYAGAQLTIVATDSDDPNHGLPGVRGTKRKPQPTLQIGDHKLVSSLRTPWHIVPNSKWSTRGWTYQEGLLSNRRLMFSDEQVMFECNGMHCQETLHLPLDMMHDQTEHFCGKILPGAFQTKDFRNHWSLINNIKEFSARNLTFPTDAINAMRGIFHIFEQGLCPVYHLTGVPIMPPYAYFSSGKDWYEQHVPIQRSPEAGFLIGLLWWHRLAAACARQPCFPSWSWAGWNQCVMDSFEFDETSTLCDFGAEVSVQHEDGSFLRFPKEHTELPNFLTRFKDPRIIQITAKTSACEIFWEPNPDVDSHPSFYAVLVGDDRVRIGIKFHPDWLVYEPDSEHTHPYEFPLIRKKLTALIIAPEFPEGNMEWNLKAIVIDERDDGQHAERVGLGCATVSAHWPLFKAKSWMIPLLANPNSGRATTPRPTKSQKEFMGWLERRPTRTIVLG